MLSYIFIYLFQVEIAAPATNGHVHLSDCPVSPILRVSANYENFFQVEIAAPATNGNVDLSDCPVPSPILRVSANYKSKHVIVT